MAALGGASQAADLFEDGKAKDVSFRTLLEASDTIGGYTMYPGEGKWRFEKTSTSTATGPSATILGSLIATQEEAGTLFARLLVTTNLTQGDGRSWAGSPCAPGHLVMRNKGRGREDNCLTIDPISLNVGNKQVTMLSVRLTNTASGGRYYTSILQLNPALLGFRETGVGDWSEQVVGSQPFKQAFMGRLTAWAEKLQDATYAAFDFNKPQDSFKDIPSWRSLLPVPAELADKKFSWSFLSAIEDIHHNKAGFKALAYSHKGYTHWGSAFKYASQELADEAAMTNCKKNLKADAPECQLYSFPAP